MWLQQSVHNLLAQGCRGQEAAATCREPVDLRGRCLDQPAGTLLSNLQEIERLRHGKLGKPSLS